MGHTRKKSACCNPWRQEFVRLGEVAVRASLTRGAHLYRQGSSVGELLVGTLGVRRVCPRLGTPSHAAEK